MSSVEKICSRAVEDGVEVRRHVPLKTMTTFKIGGEAEAVLVPKDVAQLSLIARCCSEEGVVPFILGNGSNVLFSDTGYSGILIHLEEGFSSLSCDGERIVCGSAVSLSRLCRFALEHGLTGMEFAYGVPGSVGGAAFMNAGAYGGEMKDVIVKCSHVAPDGEIGELEGAALNFGYRNSAYKQNRSIVTSVELLLKPGDPDRIRTKMEDLIGRRRRKQPVEYPSAGSVFKRPPDHFAGTLIEQCGLKGKRIGGAQVSEKHAGFIINTGDATARDVLELIRLVQNTVLEKTGIRLEPEVMMVSN